jgi:hypothetical protein
VPKGGKNFSCHDQTLCDRTVTVSPEGVQKMEGQVASAINAVTTFNKTSLKKWGKLCSTKVEMDCKAELLGTIAARHKDMVRKVEDNPKYSLEMAEKDIKDAETYLRAIVMRPLVQDDANWIAGFAKACRDDKCKADIAGYANAMRAIKYPGLEYESKLSVFTVREKIKDQYYQLAYFRKEQSISEHNKK